jgi:hypothetical protein
MRVIRVASTTSISTPSASTSFAEISAAIVQAIAHRRDSRPPHRRRCSRRNPVDYEERKPLNLGYAKIAPLPSRRSPLLVSTIDVNRDTDFNEVSFDTVELVRSDKVLSERNTETLARLRLS